MKKIISTILAIALTMGLIVAPAYAADASLIIESKTAKAGDEVTMSISLKNNPGVSSMTLTPTFDKNVLSLSTKANSGENTTVTVGKKIVIYTPDGYNIYDDEIVATLKFEVTEEAPSGKYDISFKIDSCYNEDDKEVTLTPNPVVSTITVPPTIKEASVVVEDNLTLNIGVDIPESIAEPKVRFTVDGFTDTVSGTEEGEYTWFSFKGITSVNMADTIDIELLDDDSEVILQDDYSIREYCDKLYSENDDETLRALLANMLNYGAESQKYASHNTDDLANDLAWVAGCAETFALPSSDYKVLTSYSDDDCRIKSAILNLNRDIRFKFSVLAPNAQNATLVVSNGTESKEYDVSKGELVSGAYVITTNGLSATQYGRVYTITLKYNGSPVHSINYSVNSYIASKQSSTVSNLANLVKSINNYGMAAIEYANNN